MSKIENEEFYDAQKIPHLRYLHQLVKMKCGTDLLDLRVFPNAKEVTESFAAFSAAQKYSGFDLSDEEVNVVCVGDGTTPRTGATFAFRSKWKCHSVDPNLKKNFYNVQRLTLSCLKIEDFELDVKKAIIVAVHSHAPLEAAVKNIRSYKKIVIAIPCCRDQSITGREPEAIYNDYGIHSPHRTVKIWRL